MTQQHEMLVDEPRCLGWDRAVQDLVTLLAEAVMALPDSEKRSVLKTAITPLFEALLTLNEVEQVPGIGLIWMTLICFGYQDYTTRLWPQRTSLSEETTAGARAASAVISELKETSDVA
jgi:hypothetical protein